MSSAFRSTAQLGTHQQSGTLPDAVKLGPRLHESHRRGMMKPVMDFFLRNSPVLYDGPDAPQAGSAVRVEPGAPQGPSRRARRSR